MAKTMFPEMNKPETRDLIGLKIVEVDESLHGSVRRIQCETAEGELVEITFRPVDGACTAICLDGNEVTNIETEV